MTFHKTKIVTATLVILAGGLITVPAHAANDRKAVNAANCQPYGPGTLASELTYDQRGITNPGTTNEAVLCVLPVDGDTVWSSTAGTSANAYVFYRAGAIAGKVACTAFVSSTAMVSGPTYSTSVSPSISAAYTRAYLTLQLADISGSWTIGAPTVLLCTITPKATLGGYTFNETVVTHLP